MSVQSGPTFKRYAANGVATVYAIPFLLIDAEDLQTTLNGVPVTSGFTLSGVGNPTSICTFSAAPEGDLLFQLVVKLQRLNDYQENGDFLAKTINLDYDRIWQAIKELRRDAGRALSVGPLEAEGIQNLPSISLRAEKLMAFDVNGAPVAIPPVTGSAVDLAFALSNNTDPAKGAALVGYDHGTVKDALDEAVGTINRLVPARAHRPLSPLYMEQFITGLHGRGMLAAESPSITTEQAVVGAFPAGADVIAVANSAIFDEGGNFTVRHTNGRYHTYFIKTISGTNMAFLPALRGAVADGARIERTWYNQAHPGKFYMRELAQRIAHEPQYKMAVPNKGRLMFSQLDSDPTTGFDVMTAFGGASVAYINENNLGQGLINLPVESNIGRALFVAVTVAGQGAETGFIPVNGVTAGILRFVAMARLPGTSVLIRIVDDQSRLSVAYRLPTGVSHTIPQVYSVPFSVSGDANSIKLQIYAEVVPIADSIILDQFEIFEADPIDSPAIAQDSAGTVIVGLGDSWISGDAGSTPERESIMTQLAIELPQATIINKGVGGNTIVDLMARFDADIAPLNPDYVIVNTGTNDSYNPASGTFFPNAVDFFAYSMAELISKIMVIGARPIIIGVPALAEADGAQTGFLLNDRAKTYSRYLYKRLSKRLKIYAEAVGSIPATGASPAVIERGGDIATTGSWIKHADGRLECQRLVNMNMTILTQQNFDFPVLPIVGTASGFRSLRGLGSTSSLSADAAAALRLNDTRWEYTITASAGSVAAEPMMLTMIARWK